MNQYHIGQPVIVAIDGADKPAVFGAYGPQADECSVVIDGTNKYSIIKHATVKPAPAPEGK
jgi:hypothetical protein